ncbi:hypothetical protein RJT34_05696 [Clitoria ternatea]|uniref:Uncharacterized protein n=1 Tax=Clitoria ternatea TaxID=43366 RepID=A0AAN9K3Z4_CLITE
MAINSTQEKMKHLEDEDDDEEEALSLCDLPVTLKDQENQSRKPDSENTETQEEEFNFCSWGGSFSKESEMCAADEVFFQGQILPLCLTTPSFKRDDQKFMKRCESISDFRSNSSRSSSIRSQNSHSSTCSTATTSTTKRISKARIHNQFHTRPSPQPQLKVTIPTQVTQTISFGNQGRRKSSSAWEFFRLGVVPTPEIGLQDLKVRGTNSVYKNYTCRNSSGNINSNVRSVKMGNHSEKSDVLKQILGKGGGLWSGCRCVETVESGIVIIKGDTKSGNEAESKTHAMKEKVFELKRQKQREKRSMSSRRTFEWIKELSHESYHDDENLLSNS